MILITGGLGFIGTHAARALLANGERCVVVSRNAPTIPDDLEPLLGGDLQIEFGDVTDTSRMREIAAIHAVTSILHLAFGGPYPPSGDPVSDMDAGIQSLLTVLRVAVERGVERVGVASTIGVYGGADVHGLANEDLPLAIGATHPIPAMKKIGEMVASQIAESTGLSLYSARIAGVWGPGARPVSRFFGAPQLVHAAASGREPDFSALPSPPHEEDGLDLIYAADCGEALARLQRATSLTYPVYNVGSGRETTYGEVAKAIGDVVPDFRSSLLPGRSSPTFLMDVSRLRDDTGFEPKWQTAAAVSDYIGWLRAGNER